MRRIDEKGEGEGRIVRLVMLCDGETRKRKVDRRRGIEKKKTTKQRKKKRKTMEVVATTLALPTVVVVVSVVGRGGEHRPRTRRSER